MIPAACLFHMEAYSSPWLMRLSCVPVSASVQCPAAVEATICQRLHLLQSSQDSFGPAKRLKDWRYASGIHNSGHCLDHRGRFLALLQALVVCGRPSAICCSSGDLSGLQHANLIVGLDGAETMGDCNNLGSVRVLV